MTGFGRFLKCSATVVLLEEMAGDGKLKIEKFNGKDFRYWMMQTEGVKMSEAREDVS